MTSMLKSDKWSEGDRSNIEGSNIAVLTSQFELSQIIKKPIVILEYSSSCIDLVSTTQQTMAGVDNSPENTVPLQVGVRQFRRTWGDANERESSKSINKEKQCSNSYRVIENMWNVKIR